MINNSMYERNKREKFLSDKEKVFHEARKAWLKQKYGEMLNSYKEIVSEYNRKRREQDGESEA